ncbi:MAG: hypothetical protein P4L82_09920 [Ancalomicrobiaceae bacterium]|nr:hypothetical protein [Ancalomicrobiaceae bacterium]
MALVIAVYAITVSVAAACTLIECAVKRLPLLPNVIIGLLLSLVWPMVFVYCLVLRWLDARSGNDRAKLDSPAGPD